jgi:uncharacterized protein YgiM (DUF1202 family)
LLPRWASVVGASLGVFAVGTVVSSSVVLEPPAVPKLMAERPVEEVRPSFISPLPDITAEKLDAGTIVAGAAEIDPTLARDLLVATAPERDTRSTNPVREVEPLTATAVVEQEPAPSQAALEVDVAEPDPEAFVVTAEGLNVRSGPSGGSGPVFVLLQGEEVQISETDGNWALVTSASGQTGWAYDKYLAPAGSR